MRNDVAKRERGGGGEGERVRGENVVVVMRGFHDPDLLDVCAGRAGRDLEVCDCL